MVLTVRGCVESPYCSEVGREIDREPPEPYDNPEQCGSIDVGALKYVHDTYGTAVDSLNQRRHAVVRAASPGWFVSNIRAPQS